MAKNKKKKGGIGNIIFTLLFLACLGVFIYAGYNVLVLSKAYKEGEETYQAFEDNFTQETEEVSELSPEELGPGMTVDWTELKAVNEEICGWLYYEELGISYPILHGEDNDYYLHRTADRKKNFAGSIFIDVANNPNFMDCNTIVYGHNMKNGSMFGKLKRLAQRELTTPSEFWILTPEKDYRYQVFASRKVKVAGDAYTLFTEPGEEFVEYAYDMQEKSTFETDKLEFTPEDRIVTLSTCTGSETRRLIVQGKCMNP